MFYPGAGYPGLYFPLVSFGAAATPDVQILVRARVTGIVVREQVRQIIVRGSVTEITA